MTKIQQQDQRTITPANHYVLGLNDAEIMTSDDGLTLLFISSDAAVTFAQEYLAEPGKADHAYKIDLEARDEDGDTLSVRTIYHPDEGIDFPTPEEASARRRIKDALGAEGVQLPDDLMDAFVRELTDAGGDDLGSKDFFRMLDAYVRRAEPPKAPAPKRVTPELPRNILYMAHGSLDGTYPPKPRSAIITDVRPLGKTHEDGTPRYEVRAAVFNPDGYFNTPWTEIQYPDMPGYKRGGTLYWPEFMTR